MFKSFARMNKKGIVTASASAYEREIHLKGTSNTRDIGGYQTGDLRTQKEHDEAPTVWQGDNPSQFFHFPVGDASDDWFRKQSKILQNRRFTEAQAMEHSVEGYRMIADAGTPSYQKLMNMVPWMRFWQNWAPTKLHAARWQKH